VERTKGRFIENTALNGLDGNSIFEQKYYAGLHAGIRVDKRDSKMLPTTGFVFGIEAEGNKGLGKFSSDFGYISSALSLYWTFRLPARITLATRFGGGTSLGKYEFFQAQILGGNTNLRGFRKTRFAGETALYQNTELRIKLFSFRSYLFPAQVGMIGFNDIGRVWQDGEKSNTWHHGYGVGVYLAPLNQLVISLMYGFSREENLPLIRAGFLF
jgi:outer membrane protein assembly factor BamA